MSSTNSLDLVESCLTQIYTCRKNLLHRKLENVTSRIQNRKQQQQKFRQTAAACNISLERTEEDEENDRLVRGIVSSVVPPRPRSPVKETAGKSRDASNVASSSRELTQLTAQDLLALREAFQMDVLFIEDQVQRGMVPDIEVPLEKLLDKYLTNKLDLAVPSPEIGELKKDIANCIEELVSRDWPKPGSVAPSMESEQVPSAAALSQDVRAPKGAVDFRQKLREKKVISSSQPLRPTSIVSSDKREEVPSEPAGSRNATSSSGKRVHFAEAGEVESQVQPQLPVKPVSSQARRGQQEKLRIKEQYERYMQSKASENKQSEEVYARESLTADIQSVLESLRSGGGS